MIVRPIDPTQIPMGRGMTADQWKTYLVNKFQRHGLVLVKTDDTNYYFGLPDELVVDESDATLDDVEIMTRSLMDEHGLGDWSFKFDRAVRRFGCCYHHRKLITISEPIAKLNLHQIERIRQTVLHEIAHALCDESDGHNDNWRRMARSIGHSGERTYSHADVVTPKRKTRAYRTYRGECPNCERVLHRSRRTNIACGQCCKKYNHGKYTERFAIVWES